MVVVVVVVVVVGGTIVCDKRLSGVGRLDNRTIASNSTGWTPTLH